MLRKKSGTSDPNRKISETFLAFAAPLLDAAGGKATKEQVERILQIAFTVWNSVVFDTVNGNNHYVTEIRQLTVGDPASYMLVEQMIERKKNNVSRRPKADRRL